MEDCKIDFTAGRNQNIPKATKLCVRAKGKPTRVFSDRRYSQGIPWSQCWVNKYVKAWA